MQFCFWEGFVLQGMKLNDRVNISKCSQQIICFIDCCITQRTDREVFILTNLFNYDFDCNFQKSQGVKFNMSKSLL